MTRKMLILPSLLFLFSCNSAPEKQVPADTVVISAQTIPSSVTKDVATQERETVKAALSLLFRDDIEKGVIDSFSRTVTYAHFDLNADGSDEILVGTKGGYFCGTGGCTILLLNKSGALLNKFTVADYPVRVDMDKTNGWHNLVISSKGKDHLLKYNGNAYPSNPSTQPLSSVKPEAEAAHLLDDSTASVSF